MSLEDRIRARAQGLERLALRGDEMDRRAREFAARELRELLDAQREEEAASSRALRATQESYGRCPRCGGLAETVSVGVVLVERTRGELRQTSRPDQRAPVRVCCAEGHWWVKTDDGPVRCEAPEEVEVIHEP